MKVVSFWPSTGCAMLSFSASHTSAPSFCLMLLPLYLLVFHRVLWLCWVGILRRCKASYGEVRAGWQAPSLHGQWPWREMKEVPVCTLAAQTGLQSSVKSLLPPLPRCLSCAPYPFHTFFDFRWGGKECHSTLVFGPLFFLSPSSCLSHDLAPFSWSQWASAKLPLSQWCIFWNQLHIFCFAQKSTDLSYMGLCAHWVQELSAILDVMQPWVVRENCLFPNIQLGCCWLSLTEISCKLYTAPSCFF